MSNTVIHMLIVCAKITATTCEFAMDQPPEIFATHQECDGAAYTRDGGYCTPVTAGVRPVSRTHDSAVSSPYSPQKDDAPAARPPARVASRTSAKQQRKTTRTAKKPPKRSPIRRTRPRQQRGINALANELWQQ